MEPLFDSDRHALYTGWVIGRAVRAGLAVTPVYDDDGNYTDRFVIDRIGITVVVPPPPDDWTVPDA
jgi:hypothetical protein